MKLNWGHKLVIFTVLFMIFILSMVFYISTQKVELVEDNYYEEGIRYQDVIDQSVDASKMIEVTLDANKIFSFKPLAKFDSLLCKLSFYRPSSRSKDFSVTILFNDTTTSFYDAKNLENGPWKLTLSWEDKKGKHQLEKEYLLK